MILLVFITVFLICLYVKWSYNEKRYPKPPLYPGCVPILGHSWKLVGDNEYFCRLMYDIGETCNKNNGVILFKVFWENYYVITDPEDFNTAANQCLRKHYTYAFFSAWLGDGMLTAQDTEIWRRHRKLLNPAFSQQVIDGFLPIFNHTAKVLVDKFKSYVGRGPFDHSHCLDAISLEGICQTSFGITPGEIEQFSTASYMKAAQRMMNIASDRFRTGYGHSDFLYSLTSLKRRQDLVVDDLNKISEEVLQAKRNKGIKDDNMNGIRFKAFMDLALELSDKGLLTEKEVWEEMNTIIVAGYETTGNTVMFTLLVLGSYPEVQSKVYEEIQAVFESSHRDVEKQDLPKLVYLEAVIKESMRLYCITPVMLRSVDKDLVLKNCTVPAGSSLLLFNCFVHRHPAWGEDAAGYRPERWLAEPVHAAFTGFGVGKRLCMGKNYAMMTMKTMLVHVLRHYRISSDLTNLRLKVEPLLKPVSGHHIALEYRN